MFTAVGGCVDNTAQQVIGLKPNADEDDGHRGPSDR